MEFNIKKLTKFFILIAILFQFSSVFPAMKTDPNVQLIDAAKKGDLEGVKKALKNGANVNVKSHSPLGNTALHIAAYDGNLNLVKILRRKGADPRILNNKGKSSIDLARQQGHNAMAQKFEEDMEISSTVPSQFSSQVSQPSPAEAIVQYLQYNWQKSASGKCPASGAQWKQLKQAIENSDLASVKKLMPSFGSALYISRGGKTILQWAQDKTSSSGASQYVSSSSSSSSQLPDLSLNNNPKWYMSAPCVVEGKAVQVSGGALYWGNTKLCDFAQTPVRFYHPKQDYYGQWFGNFSQHKATYGGDTFNTSEHAFQAQKIALSVGKNQDYYKILNSNNPDDSKKIARQYFKPAWDNAKIDIMLNILRSKFQQNSDCAQQLKATGDRPLLEHSVTSDDKEWGIGASGNGKNLLGILLMIVRSELK